MTAPQTRSFDDYTTQLRSMAETLRAVADREPGQSIEHVLAEAAQAYGTTPSQMKYALSFAGVKNLVKVDYDSSTVTALAAA